MYGDLVMDSVAEKVNIIFFFSFLLCASSVLLYSSLVFTCVQRFLLCVMASHLRLGALLQQFLL